MHTRISKPLHDYRNASVVINRSRIAKSQFARKIATTGIPSPSEKGDALVEIKRARTAAKNCIWPVHWLRLTV